MTGLENFLGNFGGDSAKVYFRMLSGQEYQGWIYNVGETTFEYLDSGPLATDEPYVLFLADIDTTSFSYWNEALQRWVDYGVPDKTIRRNTD